jgi:hypothetical protein
MNDKDIAKFVHTALFRTGLPPSEDDPSAFGEYLADALYDAAQRARYRVPPPMGNPSARWLFSHEMRTWLSENDATIRNDLAMYTSSVYHPVTEAKRPAKRRR